ncbi:HlyD family efflux transporter periplasmic adaptor subunit [Ferrimonas sediminicola]|uniref:HlyD family efflux transporter periplasmic adaptor subunit n=1 Tax=Ferrimonas sediminicola TaxID=2569538 RepID=A0A4U1BA74_9GAMM|nr:efflux RND transporter periplasmic adaptor subunit [Ferrimonas sediminicola]TKB47315.1 HlyD family efflux transporter periplasmic adaptor subunit [Ferrimonas sediminicola]
MRTVFVVAALLLSACTQEAGPRQPDQPQTPNRVQVSGELASADSLGISPPPVRRQWQYQVKYLAPEGVKVSQGELLVRLDTSDLRQRLQLRQADLAAVEQDIQTSGMRNEKKLEELKLNLAEARMNREKARRKFAIQDDSVARLEREKYARDAAIAEARVSLIEQQIELEREGAAQRLVMLQGDRRRWQSRVAQLQADIGKMTITAPRDGMVVIGTTFDGNKIKEGATVFAGDDLVRLPDLSRMVVNLVIPEVEARKVNLGQRVVLRLDAAPEKEFHGVLTEISPVFRRKNQSVPVVVFDAVATIEDADARLMRPGMTAKVEVLL